MRKQPSIKKSVKFALIQGVRYKISRFKNRVVFKLLYLESWNRFYWKEQYVKFHFIPCLAFDITTTKLNTFINTNNNICRNSVKYWHRCMDAMTFRTSFFNWAMLDGAVRNTRSFTKPERNKSKGDQSGDLAGLISTVRVFYSAAK